MAPLLLVTGASGFIGAETIVQALDKGYRARLAIRRPEQADELRARFADTGRVDQLEFAVVPAIDDKEALKPALSGVDYVLHIASPMPSPNADLQTGYVQPAVRGTAAVLEVAATVSSIKRVIITSSFYALAPMDIHERPGFEIQEGANPSIVVDLDAPSPPAPYTDLYKYHISKVLAHRHALEFAATQKPAFDVLTVHPYYVIGHDRALHRDSKTGAPQHRPVPLFYTLSLQQETPLLSSAYADVRDVAAMEVGAITVKNIKPRGEITEVLALGPRVTWAQIRDFVKTKYPDFPLKQTGDGDFGLPMVSNTDRATRDMGIVLHDPLETLAITIDQYGLVSL